MRVPRRMSFIVLILWMLFNCGNGIESTSGIDFPISNVNTDVKPKSVEDVSSRASLQNQYYYAQSTLDTSNIPTVRIKTTSRSKLWSPYSTLGDFMEENDEEQFHKSSNSPLSKIDLTTRGVRASIEPEATGENDAKPVQKLPIISSIRHYRSRKSFVRTRSKTTSSSSVDTSSSKALTNNKLQSELTVKNSHVDVTDLESEQGDQPYYLPISTTATSLRKYTSGTKAFNYEKFVEEKANNEGENSGISFKSDMEAVYGIPYFTPITAKKNTSSSKNLKKINKAFLSQNRAKNNVSENSPNRDFKINSSHTGNLSLSKSPKYGLPILGPSFLPPTSFHETNDTNKNFHRDREKLLSELSDPGPTNKTKGKSGGKKSRGKSGTKRPKLEDGTIDESTSDNLKKKQGGSVTLKEKPDRKRPGVDLQQNGAFRKVTEKQRVASRLPDTQAKLDYKSNYDHEDARSDNNDLPSQLPQGSSYSLQQTQHTNLPTFHNGTTIGVNNINNNNNNPSAIEYFPRVESEKNITDNEEPSYLENNGMYEVELSRTPVFDLEDYDNSDSTSPQPNSPLELLKSDIVTDFLNIVESQHLLGDNCTRGTEYNLGEGVVDRYAQERFRLEAELTVNRANMLTRLWKYASAKTLDDEYLLHALVISLLEVDEDIFAAGNCYDENQYKNYTLFCPFGYRERDGSILVKDLSLEYPYLSNTSEWFYKARKDAERVIKNFNQFSRGLHSFRKNESNMVEDEILHVTYDDGKWSKPYFDCGGGNIWMMTYTVPFFGYNGTYYFKGTSGIDFDLRRVDIDQCPLPGNSTELNIFAASDKCKKSTTKCVPIKGLGFRRGSYKCDCKDGFYFPNVSSPFKFFNGTLLEEEYEKKISGNETNQYDVDDMFECLLCPEGCDACVDDRPCVVSLNWLMRSGILILQICITLMLPGVGIFTWKYSNVKVVRAASPVLLRFIVLGAFFIYCTILVMYPSPNVITCTLRVWLREIGFSLAYGALMLKTWRISVIFRIRSAKAIKITDLDLMKRLGIIVAVFTSLLVIRTLVAPPVAIVSYTADELKAWLCKTDWWDHSFTIMELSFLVWGIRLCIVVRKAPSEFNESKFISLAIYNEFLLSLFLNISMLFLQSPANPDLLYIIFFCHVQLTMTLLLCLIFGSKAYIVFRGQGKGGSDELRVPTSKFASKSRSGQTTKNLSAHNSTGLHSSTTSTSHDPNLNSRLSEDVQEEFRRLYFQLEELKEKNMRLGNRHLVAKIAAMQEAADNILCTTAQINGQHQETHLGSLSNVKGKPGLLTDISEEENLSQTQSLVYSPLKSKRTTTGLVSGEKDCNRKEEINRSSEDRNPNLEEDRQLEVISQSESYLEKADVTGGKIHGSQAEMRQVQDTNLDEVDNDQEEDQRKHGVTFDLGENDIKTDCINDGESGRENIPMKTLGKCQNKQKQHSQKPKHTTLSEDKSKRGLHSSKEGKQGEKSQNHTGGNSKIVLDLDDKSRFTEEITV